jgi:hypothetical protein
MMRAPMSRMDILTESEIQEINKIKTGKKYSELIDRESAYEDTKKICRCRRGNKTNERQESKAAKNQGPQCGVVGKSVLSRQCHVYKRCFGVLTKKCLIIPLNEKIFYSK